MSRSKYLQRVIRLSCAVAGLSAAASALSADLTEVVVTAQKREESLTETPIAISAFTGATRELLGINTTADMTNFTPGFIYNAGQDRVSMRGIGRYTNQLGADSSVGVYEDGAFETFTTRAGNSTLFIDRTEILRGPQGTLYGRASIGGAINIISRRPTKDFYGEVRFTFDEYHQHIEEGAVSGPITDNIQFRVAATKYDQTRGYFRNVGGGPGEGNVRDEWYAEGQLQAQFGDADDAWLKVFGGEWSNGAGNAGGRTTNQVIVGLDGNTPLPGGVYPANGPGFTLTNNALIPSLGVGFLPGMTVDTLNPTGVNPGNNNIRNFYSVYPQYVTLRDYYGAVLQYNHHFEGADLKYIGSAQHYNYFEGVEWGEGYVLGTGLISFKSPTSNNAVFPDSILLYGEKHSFNTNELNLITTGSGPFQLVAGVYNFNEYYEQPEYVALPGQAQMATPLTLTATPAKANPNRAAFYGEGDAGARTLAAYSQLDWSFTDTWKTTIGARYSKDWKWGWDKGRLVAFNSAAGAAFDISPAFLPLGVAYPGATPAVYDPSLGYAMRRLEGEWSGVTGTAGMQWTPDDASNLYFKYSRGYKSGGFNIGSGIVANPQTDPEHSNDFQIGYKHNFGRRFQLNIDAFYDQYYDAQIPIGVLQPSGLVTTQFYNIPESRTEGIEVETTLQATDELQFVFNYGYNKTSIERSGCIVDASGDPTATSVGAQRGSCTGGAQDVSGNELPNAPKQKLAFNTNYTWQMGEGSLTFSASYIWRDKQYGTVFNRPYTEAPDWSQTDLRLQW